MKNISQNETSRNKRTEDTTWRHHEKGNQRKKLQKSRHKKTERTEGQTFVYLGYASLSWYLVRTLRNQVCNFVNQRSHHELLTMACVHGMCNATLFCLTITVGVTLWSVNKLSVDLVFEWKATFTTNVDELVWQSRDAVRFVKRILRRSLCSHFMSSGHSNNKQKVLHDSLLDMLSSSRLFQVKLIKQEMLPLSALTSESCQSRDRMSSFPASFFLSNHRSHRITI